MQEAKSRAGWGFAPHMIIGVLGSLLVVTAFRARSAKSDFSSPRTELTFKGREQLVAVARETGLLGALFVTEATEQTELLHQAGDQFDEDQVLEAAAQITDSSEQFAQAVSQGVHRILASERIGRDTVGQNLAWEVRKWTAAWLSALPQVRRPVGCPSRLSVCFAPLVSTTRQSGPEEALERVIGRLQSLLSLLPPQSRAAEGLRRAIQSVRAAGALFDTKPPLVTVVMPSGGSSFASPVDVPLQVDILDNLSGFIPAEIQVVLNGQVLFIPGLPTDIVGDFTLVQKLQAATGTNVLEVSIADQAGNHGAATSTFTAGPLFDIMADILQAQSEFTEQGLPRFGIEILDGASSDGLAGRALKDTLAVRVFDQDDPSRGLGNYRVDFEVVAGGGFFSTGPTLSTLTDGSGKAQATYILGPLPGSNLVQARVARDITASPVVFSIEGKKPTITDIYSPDACNIFPGTSEFPGSALPRLMRFQVKDHEGNPLQGEVIVGDVSEFEGGPPATTIGSFLPRRAVTDQNGIATFAFVIDRSAPAGAFKMRFSLPQFFGADGKPISASISGTVLDLAFKPRGVGDTEINYDDPSRAGQGQVGVPGTRLGVPLRGRIFGGQGGITFKIIEGNGSWAAGDEGELDHITVEDCGKISASIKTVDDGNNNGTGNIRFIPSTSHVLIAMEGFTDIFAVGPPEIEIIDANSLKGVSFVEPTQEPSAGQRKAFLLEFRLPVGFQESVRASLRSPAVSEIASAFA